ncbi:2-oxo-4-hydroxy-4-carboxy-5-ureidoimidazoline decarboxylase [Streptomyces amakusaensis]|uniref:2-oxo-4-hydroxy-4-carboxy-5-ureidoimidazoline decarboxylase n=1 Tax=Streptomyces amakusaensis TaxID=67271 RepID=A0ABW0AR69_9ACTN
MTPSPPPPSALARFNARPEAEAAALLHGVCACRAWGRGLLARRPFPGPEALLAASDTAVAELTARELAEALAGHPPIGRPEPGDPVSAREQRAMAGATAGLRAEMRALNQAYQERFGHVFLICATGLTAERLRDAIRLRVENPPEREREIVRTELARINRLRLARLLDGLQPPAAQRPPTPRENV